MRGTVRCAICAALLMAMAMPVPAAAQTRSGTRDPVVQTRQGAARGLTTDGADKFLGLPYAAAPVGALRWHAPAPPARWHGTRAATSYASRCPQPPSTNGAGSENEDCLYLNVFRPARAGRGRHGRLPVLFWIHGGGFNNGSGDQHDGALLARTNDIVVVSINYRLGVFGFLALPSLDGEAPGTPSATTACSTSRPRCAGRAPTSRPSAAIRAVSPSPASRRAASRSARCSHRHGLAGSSTPR
jgi:hypothetical protein